MQRSFSKTITKNYEYHSTNVQMKNKDNVQFGIESKEYF